MSAHALQAPSPAAFPQLPPREIIAALASAATLGLLIYLQHAGHMPTPKQAEPPAMVVSVAAEPEPTPPPAQPQPPTPTPAKAEPLHSPAPQPTPLAKSVVSKSTEAPAKASPAADSSAKPASTDTSHSAAPSTEKSVAAPVVNTHGDRQFEARIRSLIEARKSYPTGRQAAIEKPAGTVHACVELARDGSVREVRIKEGGGSPLLDQAARRLMQGLDYPAFPDSTYGSAGQHEFCTQLKYEPPGS